MSPRSWTRLAPPAIAIGAFLNASAASAQPALSPRDLPVSRLETMIGAPPQPAPVAVSRLSDRAELDGPRTLSLTFPKPAPVRDVVLLLVRGTPISAVLEGSVRGTFTGELRALTIRQALEAVLFSANLDYDVHGTVIRVFPRRPRTRIFELDLVPVRRLSSAGSGARMPGSDTDALAELDAGVRALLSQQGTHHLDRRAGLVSVRDFADRLDQIGLYLEKAQLRATRQVRIDARVLQVALNDGVSGVDIGALSARGTGGVRQAMAHTAGLVLTNLNVFLRALGQWGEVTTAGAPRLLATNNEPAVVRVTTGSHAAVGNGSANELSLVVTPQISADGLVQLSLASSYTDAGATADSLLRGEAETVVRIRTGETAVLSGLHHSGGTATVNRRTEVIVLLTPTIVSLSTSSAGDREQPEERELTADGADGGHGTSFNTEERSNGGNQGSYFNSSTSVSPCLCVEAFSVTSVPSGAGER